MDQKLLGWGLRRRPGPLPCLWLFTDDQRVPDPRFSVGRLPRGRAGVVLRHDHAASRATLGGDLARICRDRRLVLVVAGDVRLAAKLRAGVHLRGGRWPGPLRCRGVVTSSAHSVPELRRAWAAGARVAFLSPAFPTASHAGAPGLGPLRWAAMARAAKTPTEKTQAGKAQAGKATTGRAQVGRAPAGKAPGKVAGIDIAALGGVDGRTLKRLPSRLLQAVGAIGALSSG
jgi:thiamine-phosphate pyrophosphorylase